MQSSNSCMSTLGVNIDGRIIGSNKKYGTHFTEVTDGMAAFGIADCHDVKEERLDVVVQRFMIQEEFGQQTEILTILLIPLTVHFPHAYLVLSVRKTSMHVLILIVNVHHSSYDKIHTHYIILFFI